MLCHAAGQAKEHPRSSRLMADEFPKPPQYSFLGVLADRAGIKENHVGLSCDLSRFVTMRFQQTDDQFGVRQVHLAAIGFDVNFARLHTSLRRVPNRSRGFLVAAPSRQGNGCVATLWRGWYVISNQPSAVSYQQNTGNKLLPTSGQSLFLLKAKG